MLLKRTLLINKAEHVTMLSDYGNDYPWTTLSSCINILIQKQPFRGVLLKRCSENMQQIYRRTPIPKYDFNKVAKQLY